MIPVEWIDQAETRIRPYIRETPLTYDPDLEVFLKWENQQVTGSFKARGALNKVLLLQDWELQKGIVTASAGNHGQGVALAASRVNTKAIVFASEHATGRKIEAMRALGAEVRLVPGGYAEAEQAGLTYARKTEATWVSPYNDGQVVAGQGTLALEILKQEPGLNRAEWIVPVGGGGLISGIGSFLSGNRFSTLLTGAQSTASPYFHYLLKKDNQDIVVEKPSIADGLAGPVEPGSITIPIVRQTVSEILLMSEQEIEVAIAYAWQHYRQTIEGSAAVPLAAALSGKIHKRPAVLILSGGKIQPEIHAGILIQYTHDDSSKQPFRDHTR